jgi:hypothetical protein
MIAFTSTIRFIQRQGVIAEHPPEPLYQVRFVGASSILVRKGSSDLRRMTRTDLAVQSPNLLFSA